MVDAKLNRQKGAQKFLRDERGNVAIIFGLSVIPMFTLTLMTVDFTRLAISRSRLQQAVDAAALQAALKITPSTTDADALRQASVFVKNNYPSINAVVASQGANPVISADRTTLCIQASGALPTTAAKLVGVTTMTPFAKACANLAGGTDPNTTYEVALVLDNSGSMGETDNSGVTKIQALRDAATSFTNTMFSKVTTGKLKMSITPFNAAVIAVDPTIAANRTLSWIDTQGQSSQHWTVFGDPGAGPFATLAARNAAAKANANTNGFTSRFDIIAKLKSARSSWDWNGCFEPQPYPMDVNDTPPTAVNPDTLFVPYLYPDEPVSSNGHNYLDSYLNDDPTNCPNTNNPWRELIKACKYKNPSIASTRVSPDGVCPASTTQILMRLNSTQNTILNKISGLSAGGTTNLHEGFMWGWRTISPNGPFADAQPYNTQNNRKVMIFMTDGFNNWQSNTNTVGGSQYEAPGYYSYNGLNNGCSGCGKNKRLPDGSKGNNIDYQSQLAAAGNSGTDYHDQSRNAQDELTLEACTNAKAQGIEIFTIGFTIPSDPIDTQGLALLQNCATNKDHYFTAQNASQLNAVFATIGTGLGKLRLSL